MGYYVASNVVNLGFTIPLILVVSRFGYIETSGDNPCNDADAPTASGLPGLFTVLAKAMNTDPGTVCSNFVTERKAQISSMYRLL